MVEGLQWLTGLMSMGVPILWNISTYAVYFDALRGFPVELLECIDPDNEGHTVGKYVSVLRERTDMVTHRIYSPGNYLFRKNQYSGTFVIPVKSLSPLIPISSLFQDWLDCHAREMKIEVKICDSHKSISPGFGRDVVLEKGCRVVSLF